jgi:hypothetical protein
MEVFELLSEAESHSGPGNWHALSRAQAYLILGKEELCRQATIPLVPMGNRGPFERTDADVNSARLLIAESYLQERDIEKLGVILREIGPKTGFADQDLAVLIRLQIEFLLHGRNREAAWRQVGNLARLCAKTPNDRGLLRTLHLACARLHLSEGDTIESHRRLQLAENEAEYPLALWEVRLQLGMTLEAEGRNREAVRIWEDLSQESVGTRFGVLAESRKIRLLAPMRIPTPVASAHASAYLR